MRATPQLAAAHDRAEAAAAVRPPDSVRVGTPLAPYVDTMVGEGLTGEERRTLNAEARRTLARPLCCPTSPPAPRPLTQLPKARNLQPELLCAPHPTPSLVATGAGQV